MTKLQLMSLRQAVLLMLCTTLAALHPCHSFSTRASSLAVRSTLEDVGISSRQHIVSFGSRKNDNLLSTVLSGRASAEEEDRSRPNIVVLKTHEDYVNFLEEDDRLCVVKFYATWCKSCQKFGVKYRHLAFEEGDRVVGKEGTIIHSGKVRFAEIEYAASAKLCKLLEVKKLPTVHMYRKRKGKIADMTCKPSLFHLVVDELHRVLDDDSVGISSESSSDVAELMESVETKQTGIHSKVTSESFNEAMEDGQSTLGNEIVASLQEEKKVTPKKATWFPFR